MFAHLTNINNKVADAANNFSTMVCSSAVTAMNLGNSYGEKATKANSKLTEVFEQIGSAKANVQGVVIVLQNELNEVNGRIQELDTAIIRAQNEISDYEYIKQRCLASMAYCKKFMVP